MGVRFTLRSADEEVAEREDHPIHLYAGKRVKVTVGGGVGITVNHRRRRQHRASWHGRGPVVLRFEQFAWRQAFFVHFKKYKQRHR